MLPQLCKTHIMRIGDVPCRRRSYNYLTLCTPLPRVRRNFRTAKHARVHGILFVYIRMRARLYVMLILSSWLHDGRGVHSINRAMTNRRAYRGSHRKVFAVHILYTYIQVHAEYVFCTIRSTAEPHRARSQRENNTSTSFDYKSLSTYICLSLSL